MSSFEFNRIFFKNEFVKLNIGSSSNLIPGWVNVDVFPFPGGYWMDASKPWPVPDNRMEACLMEHVIEHISRAKTSFVFSECYRAMKPGGALRVITPDLEFFCKMILREQINPEEKNYLDTIGKFLKRNEFTPVLAINAIFYEHGHRFIFTADDLIKILTEAGFVDCKVMRGGEYDRPVFNGLDGHPALVGFETNRSEAFAIECVKPG